MRRQYWVNEVNEPIDAPTAAACTGTVFPGRSVRCLAFGSPSLEYDVPRANDYIFAAARRLGWPTLACVAPQWSADEVAGQEGVARLERHLSPVEELHHLALPSCRRFPPPTRSV